MRRISRGLFQGFSPNTVRSPELGWSWPVMMAIKVLLPAPLGPTRPVRPDSISKLTLFSPMTMPYQRFNSRAWMIVLIRV